MNKEKTYRRLGDYIKEYSAKNKTGENIPVYSVTNSKGFCKEYFSKGVASQDKTSYKIVPYGCFAFNPSRINVGSVDWQNKEEKVIVSALYNVFSVSEGILQPYLLYFLKSPATIKFIDTIATGTVRLNLKFSMLKDFTLPIPSIPVQRTIVAELDKINELISIKRSQLSDFDNLAQSIFNDMFGDFEDDTPLSHFINSLGGGKSLAGMVPCINKVLKTGAVTYDCFDGNAVKDLPIDYVPLPEHLLKNGDLLVSRMNSPELVGSCAYVWKAPANTYLPDRLWRAELKQGNNPIYLWFSIIQLKAKEQIRTLASGTSGSMKNISKPRFLSVKIKNVPLSLQQEFAKRIELIEQQKTQISSTIKDLETLLASRMQYWFD